MLFSVYLEKKRFFVREGTNVKNLCEKKQWTSSQCDEICPAYKRQPNKN